MGGIIPYIEHVCVCVCEVGWSRTQHVCEVYVQLRTYNTVFYCNHVLQDVCVSVCVCVRACVCVCV